MYIVNPDIVDGSVGVALVICCSVETKVELKVVAPT